MRQNEYRVKVRLVGGDDFQWALVFADSPQHAVDQVRSWRLDIDEILVVALVVGDWV